MRLPAVSTACDRLRCDFGQATVEVAIVLAAFMVVAIAYGALWDSLKEGVFIEHALQSASHHIQQVSQGAWGDVLAY